jgi:hypothetical protein
MHKIYFLAALLWLKLLLFSSKIRVIVSLLVTVFERNVLKERIRSRSFDNSAFFFSSIFPLSVALLFRWFNETADMLCIDCCKYFILPNLM